MINVVDYDGNGYITFEEFVPLMKRITDDDLYLEEEIQELFRFYDKERQGLITVPHLSELLITLNISDGNMMKDLICISSLENRYCLDII